MKTKILLVLAALGWAVPARAESLEPPVPVRTVPPKYPEEMRRDGSSGLVTVSILIDEKGNVQEPKVEKATNNAFVEPALEALKKWKFKPGKRDGAVVALRVSVPIQFTFSD
ncbi:MAG TPA: energy transducer TonB [Opitutaceae bacterium]|nr:energy transducer TonB [Opitutaceae bacterium]